MPQTKKGNERVHNETSSTTCSNGGQLECYKTQVGANDTSYWPYQRSGVRAGGQRHNSQPTTKFITIPRALQLSSLYLTPDLRFSCRKRKSEQHWTNIKSWQKISNKVDRSRIHSVLTQYHCKIPILSFELKFVIFLISWYDVSRILRVLLWGLSDVRCRELLLTPFVLQNWCRN